MKKNSQKMYMHIDIICNNGGYMYYFTWKYEDQLYSVDMHYPLQQIYYVYAIPVFSFYDESTRNADHPSLSFVDPSLDYRSMSEILSRNLVSIYDDRYNHYIQTTNSDVNQGGEADVNPGGGPDVDTGGEPDVNPDGGPVYSTPSGGQQYSFTAWPSPNSRSSYDYVNIRRSSERSLHLSRLASFSTGNRETARDISFPSGNTGFVASSPVNVSGVRTLISGQETQNRNVIPSIFIQEGHNMADSLIPQLRSSVLNTDSSINEIHEGIRDEQRQNRTVGNRRVDPYQYSENIMRSDETDRGTIPYQTEGNLVNDNESIDKYCSEGNDFPSYPFEPFHDNCMTDDEILKNYLNETNPELPTLRDQLKSSRDLLQYNTRPPEQTSVGLLQSNNRPARSDQEDPDTKLVNESLDPRVVRRMTEKGYTEKQILAASVYFYRLNGHFGVSVSKLVEILESSYWLEIFKEIEIKNPVRDEHTH